MGRRDTVAMKDLVEQQHVADAHSTNRNALVGSCLYGWFCTLIAGLFSRFRCRNLWLRRVNGSPAGYCIGWS